MNAKALLSDSAAVTALLTVVAVGGSIAFNLLPPSALIVGVLLAAWIYFALLIISRLAELKSAVDAVQEIVARAGDTSGVAVASISDFIAHEQSMTSGDSVLVVVSTLDYELGAFFETILANLNRGVCYYYILSNDEPTSRDWRDFTTRLKTAGATTLPVVRFDSLRISRLIWNTAIYEQRAGPEYVSAFSVLGTSPKSKACVKASGEVAIQLQERFWSTWSDLRACA